MSAPDTRPPAACFGRQASSTSLGVAEPGDVCSGVGFLAGLVFQGDPLDESVGELKMAALFTAPGCEET
jgi:hypothetical protein